MFSEERYHRSLREHAKVIAEELLTEGLSKGDEFVFAACYTLLKEGSGGTFYKYVSSNIGSDEILEERLKYKIQQLVPFILYILENGTIRLMYFVNDPLGLLREILIMAREKYKTSIEGLFTVESLDQTILKTIEFCKNHRHPRCF